MAKVKGICKNIDNCGLAEHKEIQEVEKSAPFVCQECGKSLAAIVSPTRSGTPVWLWVIMAVIILAGGGCGYFFHTSKSKKLTEESAQGTETTGVQTETEILQETEVIPETETTPEPETVPEAGTSAATLTVSLNEGHLIDNNNGSGSISTPTGKYEGELKNGKANGNGTFHFFKACRISNRDSQKRMAETGDYLAGQFADNDVISAKWFNKDKKQKGTIIIGQTGL